MWTRRELKRKAKEALKRNYWKIVLVAALSAFLGRGLSYSVSSSGGKAGGIVTADVAESGDMADRENYARAVYEEDVSEEEPGHIEDAESDITDDIDDIAPVSEPKMEDNDELLLASLIVLFVLIFAIVLFCIVFVVIELLYNPLYVGVQRFMLKSVDGQAQVREIMYGFDHSYKNIVKTMFHKDIRIFLWTLLFVIPGIYKKYQYRMIPYILAQQPDMDYREAFQKSKEMMNGEKWHTFVLDLSFIPWLMLCMITCGIVGVFYVVPYVELTNASLYRAIENLGQNMGEAGAEDGI